MLCKQSLLMLRLPFFEVASNVIKRSFLIPDNHRPFPADALQHRQRSFYNASSGGNKPQLNYWASWNKSSFSPSALELAAAASGNPRGILHIRLSAGINS